MEHKVLEERVDIARHTALSGHVLSGRPHTVAKPKNSFKPSVKARAGKLEKMMINTQKQLRRRLKRRQARDVKYEKKKDKCCLIDALRALGFRVPYVQGGPFFVLKDGSDMLRLFGYSINPEARLCAAGPGRWLVCRDGHCVALLRKGEGNTRIIDGTNRKRNFEVF